MLEQVLNELHKNEWYETETDIEETFDDEENTLEIVLFDRFHPNTYNGINETLSRLANNIQYTNNTTIYNIGELAIILTIDK